ncbi:hypothetical protein EX30DRAFT_375938 [Ascodesmis nigricans]|uniref:Uncharacterized protein n=1 Tax=Ascodesmis nigricans TaxID=341454 RepID=A0A4S2N5P6_9PEZI|nr:hypothetical protein EX30DRAFT_375938 [Ascodesmis nigricans]
MNRRLSSSGLPGGVADTVSCPLNNNHRPLRQRALESPPCSSGCLPDAGGSQITPTPIARIRQYVESQSVTQPAPMDDNDNSKLGAGTLAGILVGIVAALGILSPSSSG